MTVDDDDEKTYADVVCDNIFYTTPFLGEKHLFFKGKDRIFTGKQSFHKRDTIFDSLANFLGGEEAQIFGENLSHPKVDRSPWFFR